MAVVDGVFLDTSILIGGLIELGEENQAAQRILDAIADGRLQKVKTAWHCCLEFFSVSTRAAGGAGGFMADRIGRGRLVNMETRMRGYFYRLVAEHDVPVISVVIFLESGDPGIQRREVIWKVGPWEATRFSYLSFGLAGSLAEEYVDRPQPLAAGSDRRPRPSARDPGARPRDPLDRGAGALTKAPSPPSAWTAPWSEGAKPSRTGGRTAGARSRPAGLARQPALAETARTRLHLKPGQRGNFWS